MSAASTPSFQVDSEVGVLRRVLLHRPDLELRRLTPTNCASLLFDDVLWVKRARQEHDAFADTLRERGVEVLYVGELLAETVKDDAARRWLLDGSSPRPTSAATWRARFGPSSTRRTRRPSPPT
jgi:arginine deiminase